MRFYHRDRCEICQSKDCDILYSKGFAEKPIRGYLEDYYQGRIDLGLLGKSKFEVLVCRQCGFIWQGYVLDQAEMKMLYEDWVGEELSLGKKVDSEGKHLEYMAAEAATIRGRRVLDFGMGWGFWARTAMALGHEVYGVEVSQKRIDYAEKFGIKAVKKIEDLPPVKFDFINAEQVFEHIPEPRKTLKKLIDRLKVGGIIHIAVPDGERIELMAAKGPIQPLEHINCFTRKTLIRLANDMGLSVVGSPYILIPSANLFVLARSWAAWVRRCYFGTSIWFQKSGS